MLTREQAKYAELRNLATAIAAGERRVRSGVPFEELVVYTYYDSNPRMESIKCAFDCWAFAEWEMGPQQRVYFLSDAGSFFYQDSTEGRPEPRYARIFDQNAHGLESLTWLHAQLEAITVRVHPL